PRLVGQVCFANPVGPGWADPETGTFADPRLHGRDGKPYGPLPRSWAQYRGLYHYGNQVIVSCTVGTTPVLETPAFELTPSGKVAYPRTLNLGRSTRDLRLRVAPAGTAVALVGDRAVLAEEEGYAVVRIPAGGPVALKVLLSDGDPAGLREFARTTPPPSSLE